jgi:hypothetical protein
MGEKPDLVVDDGRLTDEHRATLRELTRHCPKGCAEACGCDDVYECRDVVLLLAEADRVEGLEKELAAVRKAYHEAQGEVE